MINSRQWFKALQALTLGALLSFTLWIAPVQAVTSSSVETPSAKAMNLSQTGSQEDIEATKQDAISEAASRLDQEAISAIEETRTAISAISEGSTQDAIAALERATGKLDIILARDPDLALIPVSSVVEIIDIAPVNEDLIEKTRNRIQSAINAEDLPEARELLNNLISEVRTTTINLPLATYPDAMKEAARLLDLGKSDAAKSVLQTALSTLVGTEESRPIPVINARTAAIGAAAVAEVDKQDALRLLAQTREQLQRSKALGYAKVDRSYRNVERTIDSLEQQLKVGKATKSTFDMLLEELISSGLGVIS